MLFEKHIQNNVEAFKAKVNEVADTLGVPTDWLMAVMYFESRLNPQARNSKNVCYRTDCKQRI